MAKEAAAAAARPTGSQQARDLGAPKYTGFLSLEGVYEEDTCRIG